MESHMNADFIERDDEVLGAAHTLAAHARGDVSVYVSLVISTGARQ
jgi:hypothetical protein